ncbi:MAG TPA: hypothetical protein IAA58_03865 [Candidatus Gallacutalibacter stercoravium]|nr:hypothetical protein [Candidatus Gallacutalibacter stercoravium]
MNNTLRISFALKNTYRVNSILYSLKQIPLLKKILPEKLYRVRGLKVFANILSAIWEVIATFLGKFLYLAVMVEGLGALYARTLVPADGLFLHLLLFLTVIGAFMNTYLFNPTRDKYYAIVLLRMEARAYTLLHYGYSMVKLVVGFLPFVLFFGLQNGVPLWGCLLVPFFAAGLKMVVAVISLWDYERRGNATNENKLGKFWWLAALLLLAAAYGLPAVNITVPPTFVMGIMAACVVAGLLSLKKICAFRYYPEMCRQLLSQFIHQMDTAGQATQKQSQKSISTDTHITSTRKGFEYLNELFIKRHQKILWKSSKRIAAVCAVMILGLLLAFYLVPEIKGRVNELLLTFLPYFVFIMYAINRGTGFTRALFMNCDHSLLTYSFYKQPQMVLKLYRIRLREIVKVNLLPAAVIGAGLSVLLFASGGTDNPLNYAVLLVSIVCLSIFFSVHYLTIYYLLQPYNAGTEMKSGTYQLMLSATYLVCFFMMRLQMPTPLFGGLCIAFCLLYSLAACGLIYRFAPRTFRLRP